MASNNNFLFSLQFSGSALEARLLWVLCVSTVCLWSAADWRGGWGPAAQLSSTWPLIPTGLALASHIGRDPEKRMGAHRSLKAEAQKWHTAASDVSPWPKQVIRPVHTQEVGT